MFVKPAPDRSVPDPERGGLLAAEGRDVPDTQYWTRRVQDNDVVVAADEGVQAPVLPKSSAKVKA